MTAPKPPTAPSRPVPSPAANGTSTPLAVTRGRVHGAGERVILYGTGGIGKSTLASLIEGVIGKPTIFLDVEGSTNRMDVARVSGLGTFEALRAALASPEIREYGCVVVDTVTRVEEMVADFVTRKGGKESLEDFGYGKGFTLVGEALGLLLGDLDRLASQGIHVVGICHDSNYKIANPSGEDFLRWEPRLSNNGKIDTRARFIEWADHLLALRYDIAVDGGKARGGGSRTIYTSETADTRAKSRAAIPAHIPYASEEDATLWRYVFGVE